MYLQLIPTELIKKILCRLRLRSFIRMEQVSKFFMNVIQTSYWNGILSLPQTDNLDRILQTHKFASYDLPNDTTDTHVKLLTHCKSFFLTYNGNVTDDGLSTLTNLTELGLGGSTRITSECFKNFPKLINLSLSSSNVDMFSTRFQYLTNLNTLVIKYSTNVPSDIKLLTNLTDLSFEYCQLTYIDLSFYKNLHTLNISRASINNRTIQSLNCLNLSDLDISHNSIGNKGLQHLTKFTNLCHLNLSGTSKINDDHLQLLNHTKLQTLHLTECTFVEGENLRLFVNLRELYLNDCRRIDNNVVASLTDLSELRILSLSKCKKISLVSLWLLENCRNLQTVYVYKCNRIDTDDILLLEQHHKLKFKVNFVDKGCLDTDESDESLSFDTDDY